MEIITGELVEIDAGSACSCRCWCSCSTSDLFSGAAENNTKFTMRSNRDH